MTPLYDYLSAEIEIKIAIKQIESIYDTLDPKRPWIRARLIGASNDLIGSADICFREFSACTSYSFHAFVSQQTHDRKFVKLSSEQSMELQKFNIRRLNDGPPLNDEEERIRAKLQSIQDKYFHALKKKWDYEEQIGLKARQEEASRRLRSAARAFLFSCRSFQDVIYALFLVRTGKKPGKYTSVAKGIKKKETDPDFEALLATVEGYETWFAKFKYLRDLAKAGTTNSVGFGRLDMRVSYDDASDDKVVKVGGNDFAFSDLAQALLMSARFARSIAK